MKRTYLLLALLALGAASCDKVKHLGDISRDLTYTENVDLPSVPGLPTGVDTLPPGGLTAFAPSIPMATNSKQYISESGSTSDLVKHVILTKFSATITQPPGKNFDFIDTLLMYVSAPGLDKKLVAHKYGVPKGQQKVDLDCDSVNLKEYFIKDTMYIDFGGHFIGVPDSASKVELSATFNMLANPLAE